jgi:hypothetical protein
MAFRFANGILCVASGNIHYQFGELVRIAGTLPFAYRHIEAAFSAMEARSSSSSASLLSRSA